MNAEAKDVASFTLRLDTGDTAETLAAVTAKLERIAELVDTITAAGLDLAGSNLVDVSGPADTLVIMPSGGTQWPHEWLQRVQADWNEHMPCRVVFFPERVEISAIRGALVADTEGETDA